jgi:hypothetical protein
VDTSVLDQTASEAGPAAGLDLGTAWTKLVPADMVRQAGNTELAWLPSTLGYDGDGRPFLDTAEHPDPAGPRCAMFISSLVGPRAGRANPAWGGRTAATVLRDYLACLLRAQHRSLSALTIAVPRSLLITPADGPAAAELLADILKSAMPQCVPGLVDAPIATAAYFGYIDPALAADGPILLCDAGARTFTASLCYARSGRLREADRQSITAESQSPPVRQTTFADWALRQTAARTGRQLVSRAAFEQELAGPGAERGYEVLAAAAADSRWRDTTAFTCAGVALEAGDLLDGFQPAAAAVRGVVTSLLARHGGWKALADAGGRLVLHGGLSAFYPIRAAVLEPCGLAEAAGPSLAGLVHLAGPVERRFATACGAALMAAGRVDPAERHPEGVAIRVHNVEAGQLVPRRLVLADAGTVPRDAGGAYAVGQDRAAPAPVVEVREPAREGDGRLPIELVSPGSTEFRPAAVSPGGYPPPGSYRVTAESDQDGRLCVAFSRVEPPADAASEAAAPDRYVHVLTEQQS